MAMLDYGLTGRVALVTGGSRGIGRAIAAALLAAGCRVAIMSRNPTTLEDGRRALSTLGDPLAVLSDVSVQADIRSAVDSTASRDRPRAVLGDKSRGCLAHEDVGWRTGPARHHRERVRAGSDQRST
jgi:NAD(P)-dependent dehydrogenase (short-subunit alcohol dehydrogenase family)